MILLYPDEIDESLPVYPNLSTAQKRVERQETPGANVLASQYSRRAVMYTLQGRRITGSTERIDHHLPNVFIATDENGHKADVRLDFSNLN